MTVQIKRAALLVAELGVVLDLAHVDFSVRAFNGKIPRSEGLNLGGQAAPAASAPVGVRVPAPAFVEGGSEGSAAAKDRSKAAARRVHGAGAAGRERLEAVLANEGAYNPRIDLQALRGDRNGQGKNVEVIKRFAPRLVRIRIVVIIRTGPEESGAHIPFLVGPDRGMHADAGHVTAEHGIRSGHEAGHDEILDAHARGNLRIGNIPVDIGLPHADIHAVSTHAGSGAAPGLVGRVIRHGETNGCADILTGPGLDGRSETLIGHEGVGAPAPPVRHIGNTEVNLPLSLDLEIDGLSLGRSA